MWVNVDVYLHMQSPESCMLSHQPRYLGTNAQKFLDESKTYFSGSDYTYRKTSEKSFQKLLTERVQVRQSQINDKWRVKKKKRWSSGWGCTDLRASCRSGTAPYCDLLVDKHTNLCLMPLFFAKKNLCFSLTLFLFLEMCCLTHCFPLMMIIFLPCSLFLSLVTAFITFSTPFFFTYLLSLGPPTSLSPLGFCSFSALEKTQSNQMCGESGLMGGAQEWRDKTQ